MVKVGGCGGREWPGWSGRDLGGPVAGAGVGRAFELCLHLLHLPVGSGREVRCLVGTL